MKNYNYRNPKGEPPKLKIPFTIHGWEEIKPLMFFNGSMNKNVHKQPRTWNLAFCVKTINL